MASPRIITTDLSFVVFSMEADTDYLLARMINFLGIEFYSRAGFFAQQACEKYMKALSVQRDGTYGETHKLKELAALCESYGPYFLDTDTTRILEQFDLFDQIGRYGGAANFDPLAKGKPVGGMSLQFPPDVEVAGAWIWPSWSIDDLDAFVFKARSFLDFNKAQVEDGLKSILEGKRRWTGKPPLRVVLTKNNRYFN